MFGFFEAIYSFLMRQIGNRTDAASSTGSLHAKVKDAKETINSKIGTASDTRTSNTVMGFASTQIKSIQRGTAQRNSGSSAYIDVTISAVDLSKSFVVCSTSVRTLNYTDPASYLVRCRLTSPTNLRIEALSSSNTDTDWQVIEFY